MDPNAAADKPNVVNSGLEPPVNSVDPLSNLQNVVDAAKKEAAAAQTTASPQTPQAQFENQFGEGKTTPPPAEPAPDLMGQALANLGTAPPAVDASTLPEQTQPVEVPTQPEPEQTPAEKAEKLKQEIAAKIDAFLEEVTKEKMAV